METDVPMRKLLLRIVLRFSLIVTLLLFISLVLPKLLDLFLPFVLAFCTATLLAPVIRRISKKMGTVRKFWAMLFILLLILALTGLLVYAGYYLFSQISDLLGSWQSIQASTTELLDALSAYFARSTTITSTELEEYLLSLIQRLLSWLTEAVSSWAPTVVISVGNLASGIASFVISLLFFVVGAYFMTADYPNLREKLSGWIPDMIRPHASHIKDAMGTATFGYLKAQLILSSIVTAIIFISLLIWGQRYSLIIAIVCGIIDIIPFFGSGTVLVPWAIVEMFMGHYGKAIFLLILALVLFLFRKLAEPKVVGDQTGLSPLVSLMSIYVGMKLGGVVGMILAPILCMIVLSLYRVGFFTPTIEDFRQLGAHIIREARLDSESSDKNEPKAGG